MNTAIFQKLSQAFVLNDDSMPFSFLYGGENFNALEKKVSVSAEENAGVRQETITCLLPDGMKTETTIKYFPKFGAFEWVTWFENTGKGDSQLLSEIYDCDVNMPFDYDQPYPSASYVPGPEVVHIYNPNGSTWNRNEFASRYEHLMPGKERSYKTFGGRSSNDSAPFFDINRQQRGYIAAVGWTGQWNCRFTRNDEYVTMRSGVEGAAFRLHPGERVRTTSVVILPYENGQTNGHNAWRRLIREQFSLIGQPGREAQGPLMSSFWGGLPSETLIDRINHIAENNLGFEYVWIDAGWYGHSTGLCINEFEGDWPEHTGSWVINKTYHPNGMKDVSKAISDGGMKFLLWVEPERCRTGTDMVVQHPDWFLRCSETDKSGDWLLDLGNPEACQGAIDLIAGLIRDLNLSCYRQDFNFEPLPYWRENDEPERAGLKEIKHIMGLYHFWDTLLEMFPHLIIDNCASGGRRIDIETLRRSMPMWRSDYQCNINHDPETAQTHQSSIAWWMPYSGTGAGNQTDIYRFRSCYAASLQSGFWYCGLPDFEFEQDTAKLDWIRQTNAEYLRVRPFLAQDYYPLIMSSMDDSNWSASQYHNPETGEGIVMVFRRPKSVCDRADLEVGGFDAGKTYAFELAGTGERFTMTGKDLLEKGFTVEMPEKRSSKLFFYKEI